MTAIDRFHLRHLRLTPALMLVAFNVACFVGLRIAAIIARFAVGEFEVDRIVDAIVLPASWHQLLVRPWTLLTYMFMQYDPLHLIMNCLWLYLFASIASQRLSPTRLYLLYAAGGVVGGLSYLAVGSLQSVNLSAGLTGASAAVLAIMGYAMVALPDVRLRLFFFGEASLKIVGLIAILLVVIATGLDNYVTHAAHAGGFICGLAYGMKSARSAKPAARRRAAIKPVEMPPVASDASLDDLLDKIRRSGYGSLTASERDTLFRISSNLQKRKS